MAIYIDDRELVAAHRAGDAEAFTELVREHRRALLAHAQRKLRCEASAEDALQETLVRAYRALPKFDGEYRLGPWLHRIMSNVCIDEAHRRRRDGEKSDSYAAQPGARAAAPSVEDELGLDQDNTQLGKALNKLSATHREALVLRFVDEMNYSEVAEFSGISEQNVRARVSRARQAMKVAMKGVAALPLLLLGLLRRGEKAAAAATSTTGVATVSASSLVGSAASTPVLAEAAAVVAQSAPAAVPVIAKAAVGIGLAAAVLTPTSDSAVHQAVESLATGTAGVVIEVDAEGDVSQLSTAAVVAEVAVSSDESTSDAYSPIETVSPSITQAADAAPGPEDTTSTPLATESKDFDGDVGGSITMRELEISGVGGERYTLSGRVQLAVGANSFEGSLTSATWLRMEAEFDDEGRRRVDGLFDLQLNEGETLLVRLAGFADGEASSLQIQGLFRVDDNTLGVARAGSFAGSIAFNGSPGAAVLTLTP